MYDSFCSTTLADWEAQGYPHDTPPDDYFDFDLKLFNLNNPDIEKDFKKARKSDKFLTLSFSGPFEELCRKSGRLSVLKEIARNPSSTASLFEREADAILNTIDGLAARHLNFDGAWMWSDLGYKDNLFFSPDYYKKYLFPIHKRIFSRLNSLDMPVIFHSDGKINSILPDLVAAGIRALHPLDCSAGMDISEIARAFSEKLVFFGNIDTKRVKTKTELREEIKNKFSMIAKDCSYIYHASEPIGSDISLDDYKLLLETVKEFGTYKC